MKSSVVFSGDGTPQVFGFNSTEEAEAGLRMWMRKKMNGVDWGWDEMFFGPKPDPETCDLWVLQDWYGETHQPYGRVDIVEIEGSEELENKR